jgi:outer membrane biosynthesis protein TonB
MAAEKKPKEKKEKPAEKAKPEAKTETPVEAKPEAEAKSEAPKNYSRGEGQKVVTQAYKDNWNAIFGKKKRN